jgi:hypothetical protein
MQQHYPARRAKRFGVSRRAPRQPGLPVTDWRAPLYWHELMHKIGASPSTASGLLVHDARTQRRFDEAVGGRGLSALPLAFRAPM